MNVGDGAEQLLKNDLRMIKAAILYAEKVKLLSQSGAIISEMHDIGTRDLSVEEVPKLFSFLLDSSESNHDEKTHSLAEELRPNLDRYLEIKKRKPIFWTRKQRLEIATYERIFRRTIPELQETLTELTLSMGFDEIIRLHNLELLEEVAVDATILKPNALTEYTQQFADLVGKSLNDIATYPLVDSLAAELISRGIEAGRYQPNKLVGSSSKVANIANSLLAPLPIFDAPIDEILHLRSALEGPLVSFRSEIISLSNEIESDGWDHQFQPEYQRIYLQRIAPRIVEIEEAIRGSRFLEFYVKHSADKKLILGSGAITAIASGSIDAVISNPLLLLPTAVSAIVEIFTGQRARKVQLTEIQQRGLYFYYRLKKESP